MNVDRFRRWAADHPFARPTPEEVALSARLQRYRPAPSLTRLPPAAHLTLFQLLPIYPLRMSEDLREIGAMVSSDVSEDDALYAEGSEILQRTRALLHALDDHEAELDVFGDFATALRLPRDAAHPQRQHLTALLREARVGLTALKAKWTAILDWHTYRASLQDTAIVDLQSTLRSSVRQFMTQAEHLQAISPDDPDVRLMRTELEALGDKVDAVEALGDPALADTDFKGIFWRRGLEYPGGDGYHRTITYRQAVVLNLFDGNARYVWQERRRLDPPPAPQAIESTPEGKHLDSEGPHALEQRARLVRRTAATLMKKGCELCGSPYVTWVGIADRPGRDSVVLCDECSPSYRDSGAVRRLYQWHELRSLLGGSEPQSTKASS